MQVLISSELVARIVALAGAEAGHEVCGLLLGTDNRIDDILATTNIADDPTCQFEVDPAAHFNAIRAARAGGRAVIGCYHSHPSGQAVPSATDAAMIGQVGEYWLICDGRHVRGWRSDTSHSFVEVGLKLHPSACAAS